MEDIARYKAQLIPTQPNYLEIADIGIIYHSPGGLVISPTYYRCELFLSIHVINQIIQYAVKNNLVILNGTIIIPIGNRKDIINVSAKEENDETKASPSVSTPNENS